MAVQLTFVYPLRLTATWIPSADILPAMSGTDQEETSRKCSDSLSMRCRHSELSEGLSA